MLVDLSACEDGTGFEADLCIVGAGAAGITLARALRGTGLDVCLLESGGLDFDARTQALYEGESTGRPYYPLDGARLRFFGGTTAIWGGRCVPLDDIDFAPRPGVPYSGWPLTADELAPYYRRTAELLELPFRHFDATLWRRVPASPPAFREERIVTRFWQFDEAYWRFGFANCRDIVDSGNIRAVIHANVVDIATDENARHVRHLEIASLSGVRGRVRARAYVLACGGIENARLLLASNRVAPAGLGNGRDLVGRFFMEHPHARIGEVEAPDRAALWSAFRKHFARGGHKLIPALRLGDPVQRREGVLNPAATLRFERAAGAGVPAGRAIYERIRTHAPPNRHMRRLWRLYRRGNDLLQHWGERPLRTAQLRRGLGRLCVIARAEQAPNPDSRVRLSAERDALGMAKASLDWRLTELDTRSLRVFVETLDAELRRLAVGRAAPAPWLAGAGGDWPVDPTVGRHPLGGYHHMGTTRMASDPTRGVVDAQCRVHGVDNLYIAGSSLFPTGGWANPTMTLMALALRLADHLREGLRR